MADRDYQLEEVLETYRRDGSMIREKSRVLVEEWLDRVYPRMVDPDIPTSALMEIGKTLIELGDLKPKKDITPTQTGPGFSITINIPQSDGKPPITIEGTATPVAPVGSDDDDTVEELPAPPTGETNFNTPDFQFNHDLTGGMSDYDGDGEWLT